MRCFRGKRKRDQNTGGKLMKKWKGVRLIFLMKETLQRKNKTKKNMND